MIALAENAKPENGAAKYSLPPNRTYYTASEAARALKMQDSRVLRRMCAEGRVPFAVQENRAWFLSIEAIEFVDRFPRLRGCPSRTVLYDMQVAAEQLDPECVKRAKGHKIRGRLNPDHIREIRKLHAAGETLDDIAKQFKTRRVKGGGLRAITKGMVSFIVHGKRHADVT